MIYLIIPFVLRVMSIMFLKKIVQAEMHPCISVDCINTTVSFIIVKKIFLPMNKEGERLCFKKNFVKSYALKTAVLIGLYLIPREKETPVINIESSIICKPPVLCRSIIQSL